MPNSSTPSNFLWDPASYGNHRAVVRVGTGAGAVRAQIPWRRRDLNPQDKKVIVVDAATGERVERVFRERVEAESGDVVFETVTAPGEYWIYYLPYEGNPKAHYPNLKYLKADENEAPIKAGREAEFLRFEAVSPHHAFDDMERIAAADEVTELVKQAEGAPFLVFLEDRANPVKMRRNLPQRWAGRDLAQGFEAAAERGEFFVFQVAVYAFGKELGDLRVEMGDLRGLHSIPTSAFRCFNLGGLAHYGEPMRKTVTVGLGTVQAMWCGIQVPVNAVPGRYDGAVWVTDGDDTVSVPFALDILESVAKDRGDDAPERLSRLAWLDSSLASDDTVVPPFMPVERQGDVLRILGREVELGGNGLPASIRSYFTKSVTGIGTEALELLARPLSFVVEGEAFSDEPYFVVEEEEGAATWTRRARSERFSLQFTAKLEFDGTVEYRVALRATEDAEVPDVRLEMALRKEAATHMMGLGFKGSRRPERFDWAWEVEKNQDALWVGTVNGGVQVTLKDNHYRRPLNTNFYLEMPLVLPTSWHNDGNGTVTVREETEAAVVRCSGGPRRMAKGETLRFDFRLAITPFKPLNTDAHFGTRYCHAFLPVAEAKATGGNTVNVHHATAINPFINYPFLRPEAMKAYIDEAHAAGMRVKIYYTVRELTTRAPELWALLSLGNEVFSAGPGGGYSWLQEHIENDYLAAWFDPTWEDCSLVTSGMNRWHNFYVEGLDWLGRNIGIDGIYLDDVAFDRQIMKRMRRVLCQRRPDPLIDLHSANQYNPKDGFASSANLYMEHFPFIDRLWFGEYFDYASDPDYWLVEMSGIPFGLMGEMLQDGGNPWRGMVFGMTRRYYGADAPSPKPTWHLLDAFGMAGAEMIGWWVPDCPVKSGRDDVLATVYRKRGKSLVALASWASERVEVRLDVDWSALGLDGAKVRLEARASGDFQEHADYGPGDAIPVEPGKGLLLEVSEG